MKDNELEVTNTPALTPALTPAAGSGNTKEMMDAFLAALGPILDSVRLTPEIIENIKKPYIDPVATAQWARWRKEMGREVADTLRLQKEQQDQCPHGHGGPGGEGYTQRISLVNNFPDGRVRGRCNMCNKLIQPAHYEIASTGEPFIVPADKEYNIVLQLDAQSVSAY